MKRLAFAFCLVFVCLLAVAGVATLSVSDRGFSENENRTLQTKADLSPSVLNGDFQTQLENLLSDQFPARDLSVWVQTTLKRLTGRQDIGGAYIGNHGRLYQKIVDADLSFDDIMNHSERYRRAGERIGIPVTAIPVPSAGTMNYSRLPRGGVMYDLDRAMDTIQTALPGRVIDLRTALFEDETAYYRTDHHWTAQGAYQAYQLWCDFHHEEPLPLSSFDLQTVSQEFYGTLSSKIPGLPLSPDTIEIPTVSETVTVTADGNIIPFYDREALSKKDQYRVFLAGNHGITVIENPEKPDGDTLLIVKDSFANSFVPYLVGHYKTILLLDERYAIVGVSDLAAQYQADEIAIVKEAAYF